MIWWLLGGAAIFAGGVFMVLAFCWAAARGDRQLAQARRDLEGEPTRRRVGL